MPDLKIAVVGAGLIGKKHIDVVAKHAILDAVIDPDPNAVAVAEAQGVRCFSDLAEYLDANTPDGVIVASPNALHLDHGTLCLKAGCPVLIEKPLAESATSARALTALAGDTGVPVLVGHHRRHSPVIQAAREVVQSGRLGRIVAVNAMFWLNKPDDYFGMDWRRQAGGGPTYINLIHDIDLLQYLCGPISYVQANESHAVRGFEVEDTSAAILEFEGGILGTVSISDTVSSPWSWELTSGENPAYPKTDQSCYMLAGTEGSLSLPDLRVWSHRGPQSWWSPMDSQEIEIDPLDPVEAQFHHFLDVIKGQTTPRVTALDGQRNIEVLDALKSAALHGGVQVVGEAAQPLHAVDQAVLKS